MSFLERSLDTLRSEPAANPLLLPGALLMAVRSQLLAAFMFIDLCFASFFQ
ncbi:hypothetical protein SBV1_2330024 [Verrucomicrobia bacterium]|nr:hypothetical protein SBV1_2330024 [Verrucomicrobiota bacterium]